MDGRTGAKMFYLVPLDEARWSNYCYFYEAQYGSIPSRPDKALFVSMPGLEGEIAAGCVLINTDSYYLLADGFVVNPRLGKKEKYNATVFCQEELKKVAHVLCRVVLAIVSHAGLQSVLAKNQFLSSESELMFYVPEGLSDSLPKYASIFPKEERHGEPVEEKTTQSVQEPKKKRGWPKGKPRKPRNVDNGS